MMEAGYPLPSYQALGARRRKNRNPRRFLSKAVRERNARATRPWWQPSRASKRPKRPRAFELAVALREELAPDDEHASKSVPIGYEEPAQQYLLVRQQEEEEVIAVTAIQHGLSVGLQALKLVGCQQYFEEQENLLADDPEVGDRWSAHQIEEFERTSLEQLSAA